MDPIWVLDEIVLAIHKQQIAEHGGSESLRDMGLLESALNRPKHLFLYSRTKPTLPQLAASLAYGIIKNHPFIDGNKRTAYVVFNLFLELNNLTLTASMQEKYLKTIGLAEGSLTEDEFSDWISKNITQVKIEV